MFSHIWVNCVSTSILFTGSRISLNCIKRIPYSPETIFSDVQQPKRVHFICYVNLDATNSKNRSCREVCRDLYDLNRLASPLVRVHNSWAGGHEFEFPAGHNLVRPNWKWENLWVRSSTTSTLRRPGVRFSIARIVMKISHLGPLNKRLHSILAISHYKLRLHKSTGP